MTRLLELAALIYALAYAAKNAGNLVSILQDGCFIKRKHPNGPICKDCLQCVVCDRYMTEDGDPKLRKVP